MTATASEQTTAPRPADAGGGRPLRLIFTRYTIGSIIAGVATEATLLLTYGLALLGPEAASIAAWIVGAVVNYTLSRRWAWGRRGRQRLPRELLSFWAISVATMALSAWATGLAHRVGPRLFEPLEHGMLRVAFVGAVFLAVYGMLFVVKFVVFHYFVFAGSGDGTEPGDPRRDVARLLARRSRHQVPTTTRENR
ncbi:GtrA family protein [Actinomadura sp. SCN-SB]|uniref:GtrA family protein n=1 Tax=Actinomadura sp. SCN-SB TaxID=3373092 RepID=UPI0037507B8C